MGKWSKNETKLTKWACDAFELFRPHHKINRDTSVAVAITVGHTAKRLGMGQSDIQKWLQSAYGSVWVRQTQLSPELDLKDVSKIIMCVINKQKLPKKYASSSQN